MKHFKNTLTSGYGHGEKEAQRNKQKEDVLENSSIAETIVLSTLLNESLSSKSFPKLQKRFNKLYLKTNLLYMVH